MVIDADKLIKDIDKLGNSQYANRITLYQFDVAFKEITDEIKKIIKENVREESDDLK